MTGMIEDFVLRQEGLDDHDIATINSMLPEIQHLDQVIEKEWPQLNKLISAVLPIIQKIIAKQRSLT